MEKEKKYVRLYVVIMIAVVFVVITIKNEYDHRQELKHTIQEYESELEEMEYRHDVVYELYDNMLISYDEQKDRFNEFEDEVYKMMVGEEYKFDISHEGTLHIFKFDQEVGYHEHILY